MNKPSAKFSAKSSTKTSAKSGEVSFDNDDAEEEEPNAEYDWGEEEEYVEEEEQEHVDTVADHAFATPYHSHVCAVHDTDDAERALWDPRSSLVDCRWMQPQKSTGQQMKMR